MRRFRLPTAILVHVGELIAVVIPAVAAPATRQFDCVLTDTGTQPGSENRAIAVVFDEAAKTLSALDGAQSLRFASVSISNVTISAATASLSVGIDRSSLGIVWQTYGSTGVVTEYGKCRRSDHPSAASTY
jgi:hypothetical protein